MFVFGLQGEEALSWDEFKLCYDSMYPDGQMCLPYGGTGAFTAAVDRRPVSSEASQASCDEVDSGAPLRKGASTPHDLTRECFVLQQHANAVHSARTNESSAEGEPTSPDTSVCVRPPPPRNVGTSMSGSMPASTKLGERSRRSRRDSTMSLVWRPQLHLRVNVRRNYVIA
jgi:hypothetical protein